MECLKLSVCSSYVKIVNFSGQVLPPAESGICGHAFLIKARHCAGHKEEKPCWLKNFVQAAAGFLWGLTPGVDTTPAPFVVKKDKADYKPT